jgi:peptide/nickel transport system ATP-binding protein
MEITPKPILSIQNLTVSYQTKRGAVQVVRNVTLDIQRGATLALIGESGSGKTTIGLSLIHLLSSNASVTGGKLIYRFLNTNKEIDVLGLNANDLRHYRWKECSMVFQAALNAFNPVLKISEHFVDTAKAHGYLQGKALKERAYRLLELGRLEPARVWNAYAHELSGGMRQRVLIALSLLLEPQLIILDEPTSALDVLSQRNIINTIKELREKLDFSTIFISHDLSLAAELADCVATMYAGEIVELGDVHTIFKNPLHPYTIGLIRAIPTLTTHRDDIQSIPGSPPDLIHTPTGCQFHPRCPLADQKCKKDAPSLEAVETIGNGEHKVACWHWQNAHDQLMKRA